MASGHLISKEGLQRPRLVGCGNIPRIDPAQELFSSRAKTRRHYGNIHQIDGNSLMNPPLFTFVQKCFCLKVIMNTCRWWLVHPSLACPACTALWIFWDISREILSFFLWRSFPEMRMFWKEHLSAGTWQSAASHGPLSLILRNSPCKPATHFLFPEQRCQVLSLSSC